jgi:hypothetical protein
MLAFLLLVANVMAITYQQGDCSYCLSITRGKDAMSSEQTFGFLLLLVAAFAVVLTVRSLWSLWRQMRSGPRVNGGDVGSSWYRPLVRN